MDGTYAPQSPDFSSFLSSPSKSKSKSKSQHPYQPQPQPTTTFSSSSSSYRPRSPVIPSFNSIQPHPQIPNQHYPLHPNQYQNHAAPPQQDFAFGADEYESTSYMPPIPALPAAHSFGAPQNTYYPQPGTIKSEDPYEYTNPSYDGAQDTYLPSPVMSRAPRNAPSSFGAPSAVRPKNPNPNNIEIRTKFPVARIKRIMQADEEVGKVAQVTPVAVSKALELFMISLVSGAADKAREKGGKRVTAQHLKMVVQADEQFDFLSEIVGKIADGVEAGGDGKKRKVKSDMDSESEEEKKGRKGKGRRKKSDD
ncbi:DNA polymerase II subunit C [Hyphodiscus hymeniophilus]|uniref:NCT transcriptional regulatory complex subunit A n=1 Tax=Hyphodiscus hymeniophilus TaxID=353542 RepID=A0A9P6VH26_9HELO|nr:DNA polymerase II subunit C [Hyphodiscus hymeniophilus]